MATSLGPGGDTPARAFPGAAGRPGVRRRPGPGPAVVQQEGRAISLRLIDLPLRVGVSINRHEETTMMYPPYPARSEARSALPDAPVRSESVDQGRSQRPGRRAPRLPRYRPLGWRRLLAALRPARPVGSS